MRLSIVVIKAMRGQNLVRLEKCFGNIDHWKQIQKSTGAQRSKYINDRNKIILTLKWDLGSWWFSWWLTP